MEVYKMVLVLFSSLNNLSTQLLPIIRSFSTSVYKYHLLFRCTWRVQAQPGQKINITLLDFTVGVPGEPAHTMCLVSTTSMKFPEI